MSWRGWIWVDLRVFNVFSEAHLFIFLKSPCSSPHVPLLLWEFRVRVTCRRPINTESCRHWVKFLSLTQSNSIPLIVCLPVTSFLFHPQLWILHVSHRQTDTDRKILQRVGIMVQQTEKILSGWENDDDLQRKPQPCAWLRKLWDPDKCLRSYNHAGMFRGSRACTHHRLFSALASLHVSSPWQPWRINCCLRGRTASVMTSGLGQWWVCCHGDVYVLQCPCFNLTKLFFFLSPDIAGALCVMKIFIYSPQSQILSVCDIICVVQMKQSVCN